MGEIVTPKPRTPWQAIASVIFALIYGASPVDLIPDIIPFLGWLDDGAVGVLMLVIAVASMIRHHRAQKRYEAANFPTRK